MKRDGVRGLVLLTPQRLHEMLLLICLGNFSDFYSVTDQD
jgi:hypothetical protein